MKIFVTNYAAVKIRLATSVSDVKDLLYSFDHVNIVEDIGFYVGKKTPIGLVHFDLNSLDFGSSSGSSSSSSSNSSARNNTTGSMNSLSISDHQTISRVFQPYINSDDRGPPSAAGNMVNSNSSNHSDTRGSHRSDTRGSSHNYHYHTPFTSRSLPLIPSPSPNNIGCGSGTGMSIDKEDLHHCT